MQNNSLAMFRDASGSYLPVFAVPDNNDPHTKSRCWFSLEERRGNECMLGSRVQRAAMLSLVLYFLVCLQQSQSLRFSLCVSFLNKITCQNHLAFPLMPGAPLFLCPHSTALRTPAPCLGCDSPALMHKEHWGVLGTTFSSLKLVCRFPQKNAAFPSPLPVLYVNLPKALEKPTRLTKEAALLRQGHSALSLQLSCLCCCHKFPH